MINVKNINNQPLENVYIYIKNDEGYIIETSQTDSYGNFYTEVPETSLTFIASANGYKDTILKTTIDRDSVFTLVMEEPLGFYPLFFSALIIVCALFITIKYVTKSG